MRECVITASPDFSEENYRYLQKRILEKCGRDVVFRLVTDENCIGGFSMLLDGRVTDVTLAARLEAFRKTL